VSDDDGLTPPRHRKNVRANKRGSSLLGRRLRVVADDERAQSDCACPEGYHEFGTHAPGARPNDVSLPVPPGADPVEDLAAMSPAAAEMLLHRATLEADSGIASCPHVLITRDTETGVLTLSGPFETGLEALSNAHEFVGKYRDLQPRWDFTLTVAPLLPE
jgi:hypothetical protein